MAHRTTGHRNPLVRSVLLAVGWLSVGLGVLGIFLPVLPTTPFLLLAAGCFARSSKHFYRWLIEHRHLGPWVRDYLDGEGLPRRAKVYTLVTMWLSIGVSCWLVPIWWARLGMLLSAALVTMYILHLKTVAIVRRPNDGESPR